MCSCAIAASLHLKTSQLQCPGRLLHISKLLYTGSGVILEAAAYQTTRHASTARAHPVLQLHQIQQQQVSAVGLQALCQMLSSVCGLDVDGAWCMQAEQGGSVQVLSGLPARGRPGGSVQRHNSSSGACGTYSSCSCSTSNSLGQLLAKLATCRPRFMVLGPNTAAAGRATRLLRIETLKACSLHLHRP
jgi:hypothetical protein